MKTTFAMTLAAVWLAALAPSLAASGWHSDLAAAKKLAAEEKKDLLLDFTGSDWCSWCIKLKQEVFDHQEFKDGVKDTFVLVELDYPRDKTILSKETIAQNALLKTQYGVRGYPTIMLCDAEGRPYAQTGYKAGGAEEYVKHLDEERKKRVARDEALAAAAELQGAERAAALEQALALLPGATLETLYQKEFKELAALAPKSTLVAGLQTARRERERRDGFRSFFVEKDYEGALKHASKLLAEDKLADEERQQVIYYQVSALVSLARHDEALKLTDEIKKLGAETNLGKRVDRLRAQIEARIEREAGAEGANPKEKGEAVPEETKPAKKSASLFANRQRFTIAQEDAASDVEDPPEGDETVKPRAEDLEKRVAATRKQLADVSKKIDADHGRWEKLDREMEVSKARVAELEAALAKEKNRRGELEKAVAKIEREHNGDHDRAEALEKELAEHEKALAHFLENQDEITKLERRAAELLKEAEKLREQAKRLRK